MGVKTASEPYAVFAESESHQAIANPVEHLQIIMTAQGAKPVAVRKPVNNEISVIDWVNFTIGMETFGEKYLKFDFLEKETVWEQAIEELDFYLNGIFGFGITKKNKSGRNFYAHSYALGEEMGLVCIGGQRSTILVMLTGKGCSLAKAGWEKRLFNFMTTLAERAKLTRVDIAHDDFEGKHINVEWADQQDHLGGFSKGNRPPNVEHKGNWRRPNGKGRTLNIGRRDSGKYLRVYEKGRAEGDPNSEWTRAELELKAVDRILPFSILLEPSCYFIDAYPCFNGLSEYIQPKRIKTVQKTAKINWSAAVQNLKDQYGKYILAFRQVYSPDELLDLITSGDPTAWPKRLEMVTHAAKFSESFRVEQIKQVFKHKPDIKDDQDLSGFHYLESLKNAIHI